MKKLWIVGLVLSLVLAGCSAAPTQTVEGEPWQEDWVTVGGLLGAETPEGFRVDDDKSARVPSGMFYSTWVQGEGVEITDADGNTVTAFDRQIYLLVEYCKNEEKARSEIAAWQEQEGLYYVLGDTVSQTCANQSFTLLPMEAGLEEHNPYPQGVAAFAQRGQWAICVELVSREGELSSLEDTMLQFLRGFHYSQ